MTIPSQIREGTWDVESLPVSTAVSTPVCMMCMVCIYWLTKEEKSDNNRIFSLLPNIYLVPGKTLEANSRIQQRTVMINPFDTS